MSPRPAALICHACGELLARHWTICPRCRRELSSSTPPRAEVWQVCRDCGARTPENAEPVAKCRRCGSPRVNLSRVMKR